VEIDRLEGGRALIVQSIRDSATPYDGGVALRATLGDRAHLVTVEDTGHVISYNRRNSCTDAYATAFLVSGTLPPRGAFCAIDAEAAALSQGQIRAAQEASP
jgi:hypothetical protein